MATNISKKAQPKLGHAALLFAEDASDAVRIPRTPMGLDHITLPAFLTSHYTKIAGIFLAVTALSALIIINAGMPDTYISRSVNTQDTPTPKVSIVQAQGEEGETIGALIQPQDAANQAFKMTASEQSRRIIALNDQERQRLLQIISN